MKRWLSALPAEVASFRPRLLVAQAWMVLVAADVEGVEASLDAAERAFADAAGEPFEPSAGRAASFLVNVAAATALGRAALAQLRGDAEGTAAFASRTLTETRKGEWMLDSVAPWPLAITASPGQPALPAAGAAHVGLVEVAYQRNELAASLRHVSEGIALCRQLGYAAPLATGLAALAWIRQASGDPIGAREAMAEAGEVAPGRCRSHRPEQVGGGRPRHGQ